MLAECGVYSDLDAWALESIDDWVSQSLRGSVGALIAISYDQLNREPRPGLGDEPSWMTHVT